MNNLNAENTFHSTQHVSQPVLEMSALVADLQRETIALKADTLKAKKGPASPEAKERVKYNALRHGFTGQVLIMTPEEREKFDPFVKGMMIDLAPVGTHETLTPTLRHRRPTLRRKRLPQRLRPPARRKPTNPLRTPADPAREARPAK